MPKNISVIIGHYKDPENLLRCLKSLYDDSNFLEVIVTDGEAEEKTEEMIRTNFAEVKYFPFSQNLGYAGLLNKGIAESRGDYLLLMNPDVLVPAGSVQKLKDFLEKNPDAGMIGPRLVYFDGEEQDSCFRFYRPFTIAARRINFFSKFSFGKAELSRFLMEDKLSCDDSFFPADWIMGAVMFISKKALQEIGGFLDERYFLYFEDVDLARRFWENGYKVYYLRDVLFYHGLKRESARKKGVKAMFTKTGRIHILSAIKFFRKWGARYRTFC